MTMTMMTKYTKYTIIHEYMMMVWPPTSGMKIMLIRIHSQAARKFDIPYPTFVLYANRVHNMLGPTPLGVSEMRPKVILKLCRRGFLHKE